MPTDRSTTSDKLFGQTAQHRRGISTAPEPGWEPSFPELRDPGINVTVHLKLSAVNKYKQLAESGRKTFSAYLRDVLYKHLDSLESQKTAAFAPDKELKVAQILNEFTARLLSEVAPDHSQKLPTEASGKDPTPSIHT